MTSDVRTFGERLAVLETQMDDIKEQNNKIEEKLDDLIALRNKGTGVFFSLSLIGTVIIGTIGTLLGWFKH